MDYILRDGTHTNIRIIHNHLSRHRSDAEHQANDLLREQMFHARVDNILLFHILGIHYCENTV